MSRALAGKLYLTRWLGFAGIGAAVGCAVTPPPSADTRIPLPTGVSQDATTFRNSIQQYQVTLTHDRSRPASCNKCIVIVHIDVLADTRGVDPDNAPAAGIPIAHLVNLDDTDNEAYFDLKPHTNAEYYVWVDNDGTKKSRATLLEVEGNTVSASKQWNITLCHPYSDENPRGPSDFDFYEYKHGVKACTKAGALNPPQASYAAFLTTLPLRPLFAKLGAALHGKVIALRGDWIECSSGCCT